MSSNPFALDPRNPFAASPRVTVPWDRALAPETLEVEREVGPHIGLSALEQALTDLVGNFPAIGRVVILPGSVEVLRWDPVSGREVLTVHQVIR